MAKISLGENIVEASGNLPRIGSKAVDFELVAIDLSTKSLKDFKENNLILNIFPSIILGFVNQVQTNKFEVLKELVDEVTGN